MADEGDTLDPFAASGGDDSDGTFANSLDQSSPTAIFDTTDSSYVDPTTAAPSTQTVWGYGGDNDPFDESGQPSTANDPFGGSAVNLTPTSGGDTPTFTGFTSTPGGQTDQLPQGNAGQPQGSAVAGGTPNFFSGVGNVLNSLVSGTGAATAAGANNAGVNGNPLSAIISGITGAVSSITGAPAALASAEAQAKQYAIYAGIAVAGILLLFYFKK